MAILEIPEVTTSQSLIGVDCLATMQDTLNICPANPKFGQNLTR